MPDRRNNGGLISAPPTDKSVDENAVSVATTALRPTVQAAATLKELLPAAANVDPLELVQALSQQTRAATNGDLGRGEAMLAAQAHTLDAIFNALARRAIKADHIDHFDRFLKLALRAQSQCRATWEAISAIQNPPVMGYVKQANIAHGHQQVNNGPAPEAESSRARARENTIPQNELLEEKDGERLDTGAAGTAGIADPAMAPMGEVDGAEDN